MTVEGLAQAEALATIGLTGPQYSALLNLPGIINQAAGIGAVFQTVSGVSALVQAGIRFNTYQKEVSQVNMSLVPWYPDVDYLFPGVQTFSRYSVHVVDTVHYWAESLFRAVGRAVWDSLLRESRRQIGYAAQEVATTGTYAVTDAIARVAENTRWVIQNTPQAIWNAIPRNPYSALRDYYRELPGLTPPQRRALFPRIMNEGDDQRRPEPRREESAFSKKPVSGETIHREEIAPGGANQRYAPDWLLPLILGLYGDITPTWEKHIYDIEKRDGPKKKRQRRY
ncbi:VP3 [Bofec polyomavirus LSF72]|nr:VP3 [Bofec polyomavirus LSF72]